VHHQILHIKGYPLLPGLGQICSRKGSDVGGIRTRSILVKTLAFFAFNQLQLLAYYPVTMNLSLRRLHLDLSLAFSPTTPFASSISNSNYIFIHRLLFTATSQAPPPQPHFAAVNYLIQSCGLSSDQALRASKYIDHLKSSDKPDAMLQFLRQFGFRESDIRTAVSRDSRILCSNVEKNCRPNAEKLKEVGFSIDDISALFSRYPTIFRSYVKPKIDFWMRTLGSIENFSTVVKVQPNVICVSLEKVLIPNLSFLQEQLHLSVCQIVRLIRLAPFLITSSPEAMAIKVRKAEELGIRCSSRMFLYALSLVSNLSQQTIDARLNNLKSLGFSQEEVATIVSKVPFVLRVQDEMMGRKVKFLLHEVGCDRSNVVNLPVLLTLSLEKRLIPRSLVKKLLELKGLLVTARKFYAFTVVSEKQFMEKFVLAHDHAIPGLRHAYLDACAGNIDGIKWFKSSLN
jgi:mTERF domain-containing protein, mitochondrial